MLVWYYIKNYPISLIIVGLVIYFSFFSIPSLDAPPFPYFDKIGHFCMYGGLSGVLWLEFLWNYRKEEKIPFKRGMIGGTVLPILFSGLIEFAQEYLTINRSGDFLDFLANASGSLIATAIAWFLIRPWLLKICSNSSKS